MQIEFIREETLSRGQIEIFEDVSIKFRDSDNQFNNVVFFTIHPINYVSSSKKLIHRQLLILLSLKNYNYFN